MQVLARFARKQHTLVLSVCKGFNINLEGVAVAEVDLLADSQEPNAEIVRPKYDNSHYDFNTNATTNTALIIDLPNRKPQ
jgi:hypothetical protein